MNKDSKYLPIHCPEKPNSMLGFSFLFLTFRFRAPQEIIGILGQLKSRYETVSVHPKCIFIFGAAKEQTRVSSRAHPHEEARVRITTWNPWPPHKCHSTIKEHSTPACKPCAGVGGDVLRSTVLGGGVLK